MPPQTLFLDRDGVINHRIPGGYITSWENFRFLDGSLEAIAMLCPLFQRVVVVTNQQGIGKNLYTAATLDAIHQEMKAAIHTAGGHLDGIYYCPDLAINNTPCRKPNPGMALQALADFPEINFRQSIMVGDSVSDMHFAQRLGMQTVLVATKAEEADEYKKLTVDYRVQSLKEFADLMIAQTT